MLSDPEKQKQISKYPNTFYRVSLKAIIHDSDGNVLVNKEGDSNTWNLPGGGWDHGESEKAALTRELYEEVGYQGDFEARSMTTAVFWLASKQAWLLWIVYNVTTENLNFSIGTDSSEVAFINPRELKDATSFEERWIFENL